MEKRFEGIDSNYVQLIPWYVQDDDEASANYKFYATAKKMAEALNKLLPLAYFTV